MAFRNRSLSSAFLIAPVEAPIISTPYFSSTPISATFRGFDVTGIDFAPSAIEQARAKAEASGIPCRFLAVDVLGEMSEVMESFEFAYDWHLLHHVYPGSRQEYLRNVSRLLAQGGRYLSVCFSEDSEQFGGTGKYRETPLGTRLYFSSENELKDLFASYFSIDSLKTIVVEGKFAPHKAIYALLTKDK